MKKLCLALTLAAFAGIVSAKEAYRVKDLKDTSDHPLTVLEIAIADPLQLPPANWTVAGLRANVFYAKSYKVMGLDLGLVGRCTDSFYGLSAQTVNWVEGDMAGILCGGLFNVVEGNATGIELSVFANRTYDVFTGLQTALVNYDGAFAGLQIGLVDWVRGVSGGAQIGAVNVSDNEFGGAQLGVVNYATRFRGVQLGVINVIDETGSGVQIGAFNAAPDFAGLQIGCMNYLGTGPLPLMPILNASF